MLLDKVLFKYNDKITRAAFVVREYEDGSVDIAALSQHLDNSHPFDQAVKRFSKVKEGEGNGEFQRLVSPPSDEHTHVTLAEEIEVLRAEKEQMLERLSILEERFENSVGKVAIPEKLSSGAPNPWGKDWIYLTLAERKEFKKWRKGEPFNIIPEPTEENSNEQSSPGTAPASTDIG